VPGVLKAPPKAAHPAPVRLAHPATGPVTTLRAALRAVLGRTEPVAGGFRLGLVVSTFLPDALQPHRGEEFSSPPTRCASQDPRRDLAVFWILPRAQWWSASMRSPRFRRWTAPPRCRDAPEQIRAADLRLHPGTAPPPRSPRWRWPSAKSPTRARDVTGTPKFLTFLKQVAKAYPRGATTVVCDNDATCEDAKVNIWLAHIPRMHLHFTRPAAPGSTASSVSSCHHSRPYATISSPPSPSSLPLLMLHRRLERSPETLHLNRDHRRTTHKISTLDHNKCSHRTPASNALRGRSWSNCRLGARGHGRDRAATSPAATGVYPRSGPATAAQCTDSGIWCRAV
jgi:hypothetical protein